MTKRKAKPTKTAGASRKPAAKPPRPQSTAAKLKRLDSELVKLLQQRADLTIEAARTDGQLALGSASLNGDGESLRRLAGESRGPMSARSVEAVLREIAVGCRALIRAPRVAVPGPAHGFGHLAAIQHFGAGAECVPVDGAAAVFEELRRKQSDFGLISLENSIGGRLSDALDALARSELKLCGKATLTIRYSLLGKCPRADAREVYGAPAALSQCRNWLSAHLPSARPIEVTSTSTACQLAGEKPGAAAVAARETGVCFNLDVLAENIENNPAGTARFAVIGGQLPPRSKNDRTALLLHLERKPGALADAATALKRNKINLTWIESLPIADGDREDRFFTEIEGHEADKRFSRKLAALRSKTIRLETLGSYGAEVMR